VSARRQGECHWSRIGWRIAVVESDRFGGACPYRGCIPSKTLVQAADFAQAFPHVGRAPNAAVAVCTLFNLMNRLVDGLEITAVGDCSAAARRLTGEGYARLDNRM
jgi:pyruvate/2-oxoglutarate dehydrogenase complex dihydrolipoamide dehydrogenase (E3) component